MEMTNFNHANFDDDLLGGTCTSHLVPPAPRFRLLLRLPQKRQVLSQLLDYLTSNFFHLRVFLFLGLVGMSYSLWMWIRNGVIIIIIMVVIILSQ